MKYRVWDEQVEETFDAGTPDEAREHGMGWALLAALPSLSSEVYQVTLAPLDKDGDPVEGAEETIRVVVDPEIPKTACGIAYDDHNWLCGAASGVENGGVYSVETCVVCALRRTVVTRRPDPWGGSYTRETYETKE